MCSSSKIKKFSSRVHYLQSILGFFVLAYFVLFIPFISQANAATVTTDKPDYSPGETVIITGTGWQPGETIKLLLKEQPKTHDELIFTSLADGNGDLLNKEFIVQEHDLGASFTLIARGQTSGIILQTTFTDACPAMSDPDATCGQSGCSIGCRSTVGQLDCKPFPANSATAPSGTLCRASAGVCDVAETCSGSSTTCPADGFQSSTTICRASAGQCDVAESCTGSSVACPGDGFASATTACVGSSNGGACDGTDSCSGTANTCVDGFLASTTICRASAGQCDVAESCSGTSVACPGDGFASATTACVGSSNGDACDGTDSCSGTANTCVDGFLASTTICRASAGQCDVAESCTGTSGACPGDGFASATTTCVGTSNGGACDGTDSCSGTANTCVDGFLEEDPGCEAAICRSSGFYGTHARNNPNKPGSQNITQAVINAGGGSLMVCGECINATVPINNAASAVEATCVSPSGAITLQNASQLTALALNCIVSGFGADCLGSTSLGPLFSDCNNACVGAGSTRTNAQCRDEIECFNIGGQFNSSTGFCQTGTCTNSDPCNDETPCADLSVCTPLDGNCHDQPLENTSLGIDFDPPGPAGSSADCKDAIKNPCTVIGTGEAMCGTDSCP